MKPEECHYLTTGQLAKQTGVTLRTLRYYDKIGLLKPTQYNHASVRHYSKEDVAQLQKIQMLKYIGLSLTEIRQFILDDTAPEQDLRSSLKLQREIIQYKISHMQYVSKAIEEALGMVDEQGQEVDWKGLADIIQTIHKEKDWGEQYHNAVRLQARIRLYDQFSWNRKGWHSWFFEHLGTVPNLKVLELGCGDAALWRRNANLIPETWNITLTDLSVGMLEEARMSLGMHSERFRFQIADAQEIPFHENEFDIVIANHMLYHVLNINQAVSEMHRVLKPGGCLYASTMSKSHLKEIEQLTQAFDPQIQVLDPVMERFELDNGKETLQASFTEIEQIRFEDYMMIDDEQPLIHYITSTPMNARKILIGAKLDQFTTYLRSKITDNEKIYITKDSGFFLARKKG
ncbi:MerR family transcriptional regulator [Paenibacillus macquariensis]|uniref:MerR HTH family regulatory protein n=1 Tax=Paenibacillus macquariensis TaxID=948756 RepID=A0ABY1JPX1_9BACL|nr:methyltransferase domain-containing protein [Paenibacillus macquariensis]MEC0094058.1 methyltransferase domain-containing protein [Paenibacillus macquariensis]OAB37521.1 MerR family transcriptional regulator [Paenibacillus macquariensis subsp. macquariensis]SIQ55431.1 MerR HTH family regulatory protein [Paenibacillus macquariensis]